MQERGMITNMDLKVYLKNLKNNPRFTNEMIQLVEEDLRFGLTPREIEEYTGKKLDFMQMRVYSECLRNGYGKEIIRIIAKEGLTGEQMAVALEFYEKGVPLETVKKVTGNINQTAFVMKKMFQNAMGKQEKTGQKQDLREEYMEEIVRQLKETVEKMKTQEEQFRKRNEELKELCTAGEDAKVQKNLISQIADQEKMLEKQQIQINGARAEIAKLRNELEKSEKERQILEKKYAEIERQMQKEEQEEKEPETGRAEAAETVPLPSDYYRVLLDENGKNAHIVRLDRIEKKGHGRNLSSVFSRICLKRKIDVVRLVAEKGLEPDQLVQIRSAVEKHLTDQQLMVLIDRGIPAEQMKEIIDIAVYENGQKTEGNFGWK